MTTAELRERHRAVDNLKGVTATLIADDVVDGRPITDVMRSSHLDLRTAERRLHGDLMTALRAQASQWSSIENSFAAN